MLDIAVNLFGSGGGGRRSGGGSGFKGGFITGKDGLGKRREEGLVTFTVDVHTGGSTTLGIGVKELGGGAVVVQVWLSDSHCLLPVHLWCVCALY